MDTRNFERELRRGNYAKNTILAYKYTIQDYFSRYKSLSKDNLLGYRNALIEQFKPQTVNLRIRAINKYLDFIGRKDLRLKGVKLPQNTFLENVISNDDYLFFKSMLRKEKDRRWYFIVWTLAATGARISELVQIKVEHVRSGHFDIYSKGGKVRRIYFPTRLRKDLIHWAGEESRYLFVNHRGHRLTTRGIAARLKEKAIIYGMTPEIVHPHSFRHLYAKNFLDRCNDLVLLADLMGHESVDTTRIYLQRSSREQVSLINRVVDW